MAEFVQQSIEEMLPELQQMERVGLFTNEETKAILHKRKAFEYKLRRKTKVKDDYLNYIQYEMHVIALVRKRRKKIGYSHKRFEIDVAIIQRIHKLFRMTLYRFHDDVKLWVSYAEFSKKRLEKNVVSKTNARMLQIHNRRSDLWILAAKWELEGMQSMENARSLLQRGLRYLPESELLWKEYFKMELLNAEKLSKRKHILGISGVENISESAEDNILNLKVAKIVFSEACRSFPENSKFLLSFLEICDHFNFAKELQVEIVKELNMLFPDHENILSALARLKLNESLYSSHEISLGMHTEECWKVFDHAVIQINSKLMWHHYLEFLLEDLAKNGYSKFSEKKLNKTMSTFAKAEVANMISEHHFLQWLMILENVGTVEQINHVMKQALNKFSSSGPLWMHKLELVTKLKMDDVIVYFHDALTSVSPEYFLKVLDFALSWCHQFNLNELNTILDKALSLNRQVAAVKERYIDSFSIDKDIKDIRLLYSKLISSQPFSLELCQKYIALEEMQDSTKSKKIRSEYESIISNFGKSNIGVWLDFINFELKHSNGKPENVGNIYWKAVKSLDNSLVDKFISSYTMIKADDS